MFFNRCCPNCDKEWNYYRGAVEHGLGGQQLEPDEADCPHCGFYWQQRVKNPPIKEMVERFRKAKGGE